MVKIYYKKEIHDINIPRLHAELCVIEERYNFEQDDENVVLRLEEINKITTIAGEAEVITYEKNTYTHTTVGGLDVVLKTTEPFDFDSLKVICDECVNVHVPTPVVAALTTAEKLEQMDLDIQTNYEMNLDALEVW